MEEGPHFSADYLHLCACGVTFTCTFIGRGIGLGLGSVVILEKLPSGLASWGFSWPAWRKALSSGPDPSGFCSLGTPVLPAPTPAHFKCTFLLFHDTGLFSAYRQSAVFGV